MKSRPKKLSRRVVKATLISLSLYLTCLNSVRASDLSVEIKGSILRQRIEYGDRAGTRPQEASINGSSVETAGRKRFTISNPEEIVNLNSPIPMEITLAASEDMTTARVVRIRPDSTSSWARLILQSELRLPSRTIAMISGALDDVSMAMQKVIHGETKQKDIDRLQDCYAIAEKVLTDAYGESRLEDKQALAKTLLGVTRERTAWDGIDLPPLPKLSHAQSEPGLSPNPENKALYTQSEKKQRPAIYKRIYEASRCCVGIGLESGSAPFASGAIIGTNLVLTCKHEVGSHKAHDLVVYFDYEVPPEPEERQQTVKVKKFVKKGEPLEGHTVDLDYVLLEIEPPAGLPAIPQLVLTTHVVPTNADFFLVGHPEGLPKAVSDNSVVKFPFMIGKKTLLQLEAEIDDQDAPLPAREAEKKTFEAAYKFLRADAQGNPIYQLMDHGSSPLIGAICNTFHGSSGSPAMLRNSGEVFGILINGMPDSKVPYVGDWNHHEGILPVMKIVEQLDSAIKTWRSDYNVLIREGDAEEISEIEEQ